ncbi:hypothetical protein ABZ801_34135 [Actinomadura sp. NPDC047616]|uniref:hypothetical protein n=1 Tax=Actinomadura sp. NPDC047616 TaxID=3155914 RepID=UPI0033FA5C15
MPGAAAPRAFHKGVYRLPNVVEYCINPLKEWRGIATRQRKTACSYQTAVTLAALHMWL